MGQVAAKFERKGHVSPQLRHEYKVYRELKGSKGICTVYFFGDHLDMYNVVVMELMGPSLEDLFERCRKGFSLKTVLQIADQLLVRVNTLHEKSIIHRDIKPVRVCFFFSSLPSCCRWHHHMHASLTPGLLVSPVVNSKTSSSGSAPSATTSTAWILAWRSCTVTARRWCICRCVTARSLARRGTPAYQTTWALRRAGATT
jgi:serine/threonine protein kinase